MIVAADDRRKHCYLTLSRRVLVLLQRQWWSQYREAEKGETGDALFTSCEYVCADDDGAGLGKTIPFSNVLLFLSKFCLFLHTFSFVSFRMTSAIFSG